MNKLMLVIPALAMLVMALGLVQASYTVTVNAAVAPYLQVTPNYNAVNFGTLNPGTTDNPAPGQEQGIYNYTVNTNCYYNVFVNGTDFSGPGPLTINNLKFLATDIIGSNFDAQYAKALSTSPKLVGRFAPSVSTLYHGYWLTIPSNTQPGQYSTTVYIDIQNT